MISNMCNGDQPQGRHRLQNDTEQMAHCIKPFVAPPAPKHLILFTCLYPESFGPGFVNICHALAILAWRGDVTIACPADSNASTFATISRVLDDVPDVHLVETMEYLPLLELMERSFLLITDAELLLEAALTLGKPVLFMGSNPGNTEAERAGVIKMVGGDPGAIIGETNSLLDAQCGSGKPII